MIEPTRARSNGQVVAANVAPFADGWLQRVFDATETELRGALSGPALEVAQLRALLRCSFSHAPIGMAVVSPDGVVLIANAAFCALVGLRAEEVVGDSVHGLLRSTDPERDADAQRRVLRGELVSFESQMTVTHPDGRTVWMQVTVAHAGLSPDRLIYQVQDVTERRQLHRRLTFLVDHDLLTGLFNRRRFEQELELELGRHARTPRGGAVLVMDLDGFKAVNDEFGHPAGDQLLRGLASSIGGRVRSSDVVARLGGDEFALLLPGASRATAERVAADLLAVVADHVLDIGTVQARVTASCGVALLDGSEAGEPVALADAALYAAKRTGRSRTVTYDAEEPGTWGTAHITQASRLRRALREEGFVLFCQPICRVPDHEVEQYEVLIRLRGETPGELIAPGAFLGTAEQLGLVADIDAWVVAAAAAAIAAQARQGRRIVLAVNLSGRSIGDAALAARIDAILESTAIDPSCLVFEITETAAIANVDTAREFSEHLRARGCRFALDDFGSGFASFAYLKTLPFDFIKIDGSFIEGITRSATDQHVVAAIVAIARGMDKRTVAEYVTDEPTSDLLTAAGVDLVQGYYLATPQPLDAVLASLA